MEWFEADRARSGCKSLITDSIWLGRT
jgi:hypothetical protein